MKPGKIEADFIVFCKCLDQEKAIGSGGYRFYDGETVELKRIYLYG